MRGGGTVTGTILTSADGEVWVEADNVPDLVLLEVDYADGLWVVVGDEGGGRNGVILTSTAGKMWTEQVNTPNSELEGIHYANGLWVAVGHNIPDNADIMGTVFTAVSPINN